MATQDVKRKLTAILSADVEGYSRLMEEDEAATVDTITAYRETITSLIQQHRGRVVDSPGDNLLAEFASVVDAVQCAVETQELLKAKNVELSENRRMQFRIGINLGDVIEEGDRIYGDGVNIAARIEALADPGGICIAMSVYDQIKKKLVLDYEDLGEHTAKNISEPIRVYRVPMWGEAAAVRVGAVKKAKLKRWQWAALTFATVIILVAGALVIQYYVLRPAPIEPASVEEMAYPLPHKPSIAVLPFDNLGGDSEQDYLSDGFTEEIITALSRVPRIFVIARHSSFTYKGKPVKIQQVAEDLGVRYVLEGSVHKSGDRLRITAQLIDATTGHHLWAEKYDRDLTDIFAVRDEVTLKIVTALQVKLTEGEWLNAWGAKTDNLEVFVKAKQALEHFRRFNPDDNILARQKSEEALALDPNYAPAMEVLGLALIFDTRWGTSKAPEKSMEKALELAQKLLDRGDYDAHAHQLFGLAYRNKGQFEKAIAELELARAKAPNDAEINALLGAVLNVAERREEAINVLENAMRLNPFPPNWYIMVLGDAYLLTRQYEKAVAAYKKVIHIQPDNFFAHLTLAASYIYLEQTENARAEAAEVLRINPKFTVESYMKRSKWKNPAEKQLFTDALKKAGLP